MAGPMIQVNMQTMMSRDKDELFVCPYDPVHRIAAKRFVRHILKCRKNFPLVEKSVCPFNARHVVPKPELRHHLSCCPDSRMIETEINYERFGENNDEIKGDTSVPPIQNDALNFEDDEDWDKEIIEKSFEQEYIYGSTSKSGNRRREYTRKLKEDMRRRAQENNYKETNVEVFQRKPMKLAGVADRNRMLQYGSLLSMSQDPLHYNKPQLAANFQKPLH